METISLKMDNNLLKNIDGSLKSNNYSTRTEFIREAIRDKLTAIEKQEAIRGLAKLKGSVKNIKRLSKDELDKAAYRLLEKVRKGVNIYKEMGLD